MPNYLLESVDSLNHSQTKQIECTVTLLSRDTCPVQSVLASKQPKGSKLKLRPWPDAAWRVTSQRQKLEEILYNPGKVYNN